MRDVQTNAQSKPIVRAVLALGKSLAVPILAEGVETVDQLEVLRREGCDEAQSYLLGRPQPCEQIVIGFASAADQCLLQTDVLEVA